MKIVTGLILEEKNAVGKTVRMNENEPKCLNRLNSRLPFRLGDFIHFLEK